MREQRSHDCASLDWPTGPHPTPSGSGLAPTAEGHQFSVARPGLLKRLHVTACEGGWHGLAGAGSGPAVLQQWGLWMDGTGSGQGHVRPRGSCDQPRDPPENDPQDGLVGASRRQVKPDLGFHSTTRAAILIRRRRKVSNSTIPPHKSVWA